MNNQPQHLPTHIIATDLNKLRWATPNQIHITNVLPYDVRSVEFLDDHQIPYYLAFYNIFTQSFERID